MASFRMKELGPWKQVKTLSDVESNPDFVGFGGMEVLESYEVVKGGNKEIRGDDADDISTIKKNNKKNKNKKKRKLVKPTGDTEEAVPQLVAVEVQANGDNEEPKAKKVKKTKNKKKKTAKNKASEKESVNNPSTPVEKESVASEDKLTNGEADTEASSESMDKPQRPVKGMDGWKGLFVPDPVLRSLSELGFEAPTLIQALALPPAIRDKQDILGAAETGSGKTLAFGIPVIDRILKMKQSRAEQAEQEQESAGLYALVLTPTRELCVQVKDHIAKAAKYTNLKVVAIFGGMSSQKQVRLLKGQPEIIVATPGRLWDIMISEEDSSGYLSTIARVPLLVIDEADKMVEKGHFEELTQILTLMKKEEEIKRQSFVFSATLTYVHSAPDRVMRGKKKKKKSKQILPTKEAKINELIETVGILRKPKILDITDKSQTATTLVECCLFCSNIEKDLYLYYFLQRHPGRTLIFCNSIDCIRRLTAVFALLKKALLPLHAQMHQKQRLKHLESFTASDTSVLLATDVAARGLDIPDVKHVIHYQIPRTAESYVHRSGRTARAHKDGLSLMIVDEKEVQSYRKIIKSLEKDDSMSQFPVEQDDLRDMKSIVSLAQKIDSTQHKSAKAKRKDNWFTKMAKEAEIELSDSESDQEIEERTKAEMAERRRLDIMKAELIQLQTMGGASSAKFRGKYPTVTGKLQIPKSINSQKETQAIRLVSRKNRK